MKSVDAKMGQHTYLRLLLKGKSGCDRQRRDYNKVLDSTMIPQP